MTRSMADGEPPRWMWPRMVTRVSMPVASWIWSATSCAGAVALCDDDDMVVAALDAADAHLFYDVNVEIQLTLGQADRSCADSAADLGAR